MKIKIFLSVLMLVTLFNACNKNYQDVLKNEKSSTASTNASLISTNVYYVDPSGNDANSGLTSALPWKTLSKVNSHTFLPGEKVLFKAGGVWSGNLILTGSGASSNPIIVDMYSTGNKPIFNGGGTVNDSKTISLENVSYWELNNLEVTNIVASGLNYSATGIKVKNSSSADMSHIYIQNCYVHDVQSIGLGNANYNKQTGGIIYSGVVNDVLVQNCHVANCQIEGIVTGAANSYASKCIFNNNLVENIYGDGIVLSGVKDGSKITNNTLKNVCISNGANYAGAWTYYSTNTLIAHNEVSGIVGGYIDGEAFDADVNCVGDTIEYNYSHDNNRGFMLFMPNAQNIIVRYNLSVNDVNSAAGSSAKMFNYTSSYSNNQIYNNTFYFTGTIPLFFQYTNTSSSFSFNGTFNNNIIAGGSLTKFSDNPITATTATFKNNCVYPASLNATNGIAGITANNIFVDPLFVSNTPGSTNNYKLQTTSPCLNAGILTSNNGGLDYFGNAVSSSSSPDIGFYQHVGPTLLVTVYENCIGYGGWSKQIGIGTYTLAQLAALGITNDAISAINIPTGLKITVYTDDNFLGSSQTFTTSQNCLSGTIYNDAISSIKISSN